MTSLPANASPLRQRMIDEMRMRQLAPKTQDIYLHIASSWRVDAPPSICTVRLFFDTATSISSGSVGLTDSPESTATLRAPR